ncbi:hypothetical protein HDU97_008849 [Phlyctochytrium planicorne]|nr:hypothetical protein HDU97_008849 [Phlyctochytrium planicorne]
MVFSRSSTLLKSFEIPGHRIPSQPSAMEQSQIQSRGTAEKEKESAAAAASSTTTSSSSKPFPDAKGPASVPSSPESSSSVAGESTSTHFEESPETPLIGAPTPHSTSPRSPKFGPVRVHRCAWVLEPGPPGPSPSLSDVNSGVVPAVICNQEMQSATELYQHITQAHVRVKKSSRNAEPDLYCRWLGCKHGPKPFTKRNHIVSHCRCHVDLWSSTCAQCERSFKWPHDLKKHGDKTGHETGQRHRGSVKLPSTVTADGNPVAPPSPPAGSASSRKRRNSESQHRDADPYSVRFASRRKSPFQFNVTNADGIEISTSGAPDPSLSIYSTSFVSTRSGVSSASPNSPGSSVAMLATPASTVIQISPMILQDSPAMSVSSPFPPHFLYDSSNSIQRVVSFPQYYHQTNTTTATHHEPFFSLPHPSPPSHPPTPYQHHDPYQQHYQHHPQHQQVIASMDGVALLTSFAPLSTASDTLASQAFRSSSATVSIGSEFQAMLATSLSEEISSNHAFPLLGPSPFQDQSAGAQQRAAGDSMMQLLSSTQIMSSSGAVQNTQPFPGFSSTTGIPTFFPPSPAVSVPPASPAMAMENIPPSPSPSIILHMNPQTPPTPMIAFQHVSTPQHLHHPVSIHYHQVNTDLTTGAPIYLSSLSMGHFSHQNEMPPPPTPPQAKGQEVVAEKITNTQIQSMNSTGITPPDSPMQAQNKEH